MQVNYCVIHLYAVIVVVRVKVWAHVAKQPSRKNVIFSVETIWGAENGLTTQTHRHTYCICLNRKDMVGMDIHA